MRSSLLKTIHAFPPTLASQVWVRGVGSEVVVVDLYGLTGRAERLGNDPPAE